MKKKGEKLTKNNNKEKTQRKQKGFRLTSETLIIKKRKNRTKTERSADCVRQTLIKTNMAAVYMTTGQL